VDDVAGDGSPVDVYLALDAEPDLSRVRSLIGDRLTVLDLGCGPGRLANPLAAEGRQVVAVDDSPAMLEHVVGAETVASDVWSLDLGRRFDAVLALSHLINDIDPDRRRSLLELCREHLHDDGLLVLQRYPPSWSAAPQRGMVGAVDVELHDVVGSGRRTFAAIATYRVGERTWSQPFEAAIVNDDELALLAHAADLTVDRVVSDDGSWVLLSPGS
jgi:SAM-dependent methyltransferase